MFGLIVISVCNVSKYRCFFPCVLCPNNCVRNYMCMCLFCPNDSVWYLFTCVLCTNTDVRIHVSFSVYCIDISMLMSKFIPEYSIHT